VHGLTEREVYLFDVQGWLVIPVIIEPRLLQALNDALRGAGRGPHRKAELPATLGRPASGLVGAHPGGS